MGSVRRTNDEEEDDDDNVCESNVNGFFNGALNTFYIWFCRRSYDLRTTYIMREGYPCRLVGCDLLCTRGHCKQNILLHQL